MSSYNILPYSYEKAKEIGVTITPSRNPKKKIDVYNQYGLFMCSIGAAGYLDYPTYLKYYGKEYAENRRRLYKLRHTKDRKDPYTGGWLSDKLLW